MLAVHVCKQLADFSLRVSFSVEENILVLFGPSGAGKSTILRCIAGLVKPDAGSIVCDGQVLYSAKEKIHLPSCQRSVGYMFQEYALFPHMNVCRNILYGVKKLDAENKERYHDLIDLLRIEHLTERFIDSLSGGEKQRVALARAIMAKPKVLLLDEPLSALDNLIRREMQIELKALQKKWGIPFVVVTHDPEEAKQLGSQVFYLDKGKQILPHPQFSQVKLS